MFGLLAWHRVSPAAPLDPTNPGLTEVQVSQTLYGPENRSQEVSLVASRLWTDWDDVSWA